MAVTPVGTPVVHVATAATTSFTMTMPTVLDDDFAITFSARGGGSANVSGPEGAGFTKVEDNAFSGHSATLWYKRLTSADSGATVTYTMNGTIRSSAAILVYRGVATGTVIDVSAKNSESTKTSHVAPTATATAADVIVNLIAASGSNASPSWTMPSGYTQTTVASDSAAAGTAALVAAHNTGLSTIAASTVVAAQTYVCSVALSYTAWTLLLKAKVASSTARPITEISNSGFTVTGAADRTTALSDDIDTSYVEGATGSANEQKVSELTATGNVSVTVRSCYAQDSTSGSLATKLMQGATQIASWTDTLTGSMAAYTHTTTPTETGNITDRADLRVRTTITVA